MDPVASLLSSMRVCDVASSLVCTYYDYAITTITHPSSPTTAPSSSTFSSSCSASSAAHCRASSTTAAAPAATCTTSTLQPACALHTPPKWPSWTCCSSSMTKPTHQPSYSAPRLATHQPPPVATPPVCCQRHVHHAARPCWWTRPSLSSTAATRPCHTHPTQPSRSMHCCATSWESFRLNSVQLLCCKQVSSLQQRPGGTVFLLQHPGRLQHALQRPRSFLGTSLQRQWQLEHANRAPVDGVRACSKHQSRTGRLQPPGAACTVQRPAWLPCSPGGLPCAGKLPSRCSVRGHTRPPEAQWVGVYRFSATHLSSLGCCSKGGGHRGVPCHVCHWGAHVDPQQRLRMQGVPQPVE